MELLHEAELTGAPPPPTRYVSAADVEEARAELAIWRWFSAWRDIVAARRRLHDPRLGGETWNRCIPESIAALKQSAAEARAEWEQLGISFADALERAEADNGHMMPPDELFSVVAAIRAEQAKLGYSSN